MEISWHWKAFNQLTTEELYTILAVRQQVFVLEQNCLYLDVDGKDLHSFHLMGFAGQEIVAYARIVNPGISYNEVSIGRILTTNSARGAGAGKQLMLEAIKRIERQFGASDIRISAQNYLEKFYEKFGFQPTGKEYLEDDIPHTEMLRKAARS